MPDYEAMPLFFEEAEYETMKMLVKMSDIQLLKAMSQFLIKMYGKENIVMRKGQFVSAKGNIPLVLVAHLDTVFATPPNDIHDIFFDREQGIMLSTKGLGADDRAGVFGIIQIVSNMREDKKPSVLFTMGEETGGIGASAAIKYPVKKLFGEKPKYIVELDRQGANDCVFYQCDNKQFVEYVESFGFIEDWGSFSDISILCPAWKCAGVNLSIGYLNEHSKGELLFVENMMDTISKVQDMIDDIDSAPYFKYIPAPLYRYMRGAWYNDYPKDNYMTCEICGRKSLFCFPVTNTLGTLSDICPDCYTEYTCLCPKCEQPFILTEEDLMNSNFICKKCQKDDV